MQTSAERERHRGKEIERARERESCRDRYGPEVDRETETNRKKQKE